MNSLRNPHRCPTHPGAILRDDVLPALGMSVAQLAEHIGVSAQTLIDLLQEKVSLTPALAHLLASYLKTTPDSWLHMQRQVDDWKADNA